MIWASKAKVQELSRKVAELEERLQKAQEMTVYEPTPPELLRQYVGVCWHRNAMTVSIRSVLEQIIRKMGMELTVVNGQPARVDLVKAKKD